MFTCDIETQKFSAGGRQGQALVLAADPLVMPVDGAQRDTAHLRSEAPEIRTGVQRVECCVPLIHGLKPYSDVKALGGGAFER